ncbi:hypothetical protein ACFO25_01710 [Paenactinomyces guangxiensis]|uniref:Protein kinase domain-containing protein n=1 Tax=Paenactinomyces guangxiensis TaxID=1490290 RepID=A0A7W2A980_9BACL|nr:hypothetical protein [Paenactinomyces guangxiensis]MBA4494944.1 hypothetical protein [Paenactinomyces guangxiensis]MBH8592027.1 hypothetical protein [Paenactinomyces guangxiensis]
MKQEQIKKRRYYERFQVEDVINFFSGQLLQAKSSDGAQVFLQSIRIPRRPLPDGYQDAMRRLQHPHLAPILDVMEEEDQLLLVHPPFAGDPLPLLVNKERAMEPEKALHITYHLFQTLNDLEQLPLSLGATLDPKNILLNGFKPTLLFYHIKDESQSSIDEKWRELLYYLLTGQAPAGGPKQCEKQLESKQVPAKIAKLALQTLDPKISFQDSLQALERFVSSRERTDKGLSRDSKKKRSIYTILSIVAAVMVLITIAIYQFYPGASVALSPRDSQKKGEAQNELMQSVLFTNKQTSYTFPHMIKGPSRIQGKFSLQQHNEFVALLETKDKQAAYGTKIDKKGRIVLFQKAGDKEYELSNSGSGYRIKPEQTYWFELYYFPSEPLRVFIYEEGATDKWMAVGTSAVDAELTLSFHGREGATLFTPEINEVPDKQSVEKAWMNGQPWQIDSGQGILTVDERKLNRLNVFPKTQIRINAAAVSEFKMIPPEDGDPLHMDIQAADGSHYRFIWENKKAKLYRIQDKLEIINEKAIEWELDKNEPIQVAVTLVVDQLQIKLTHGSNVAMIEHPTDTPIALKDLTLRNAKGFQLIETNP